MIVELVILVICFITYAHVRRTSRYPPGPFSIPIIGTIETIINGSNAEGIVKEKYHKYGKMHSIFLGPSTVFVVINDFHLAKDLLSREEFSGRTKTWWNRHVRGDNGRNLGIINTDGQTWTNQRRFALKELRDLGFGRKSLDSLMVEEVDDVIEKLLATENVTMDGTFNTAIINVLWQIVASKRFDPEAKDTIRMMSLLNMQFKSGFTFLSFFPFLKKRLPFNEKDKSILEMKAMMKGIIQEHLQDIDYDHPRDFIDAYLREMHQNPDSGFDQEHLVVICLDFFQAGAETTSTTLLWSVMLMALHKEVQDECQREIDELLGSSKSPSIEDMPKLTFVMATLMEILRFSMVAQASLPHYLLKDTEVEGFHFEEGTMFFSNLDKFLNDPNEFPEPRTFHPRRFIDEEGKLKKSDRFVPFGLGKRICMGESLAKNELFIFFVRLLQRVNIEVQMNAAKPDPEQYVSGITRIPKPFQVKILPRSNH